MLRSPRLVKTRQWCLIAPVPMTIRITGANFSSSPSRHHIMSCDAQVRAWNAYTPYAFIQRYVSLSGRFEILRNVGFPTGRKRRRCCEKKKKPSFGKWSSAFSIISREAKNACWVMAHRILAGLRVVVIKSRLKFISRRLSGLALAMFRRAGCKRSLQHWWSGSITDRISWDLTRFS